MYYNAIKMTNVKIIEHGGSDTRVALYQGKKNIELTNRQDYECGDNGIILKNVYSSVCGTDVAVYQHGPGMGHRVTVGGEFGHETVCRVSAVGTNTRKVDILGLTFGQKSLTGSGGYTPEDVLDVMEIMKSGNWDIEKNITHEYAWEQLTEALETASDPQKALNVMIHFEK